MRWPVFILLKTRVHEVPDPLNQQWPHLIIPKKGADSHVARRRGCHICVTVRLRADRAERQCTGKQMRIPPLSVTPPLSKMCPKICYFWKDFLVLILTAVVEEVCPIAVLLLT